MVRTVESWTAEALQQGLASYRSGECRDWRKVKTAVWREANRD